jgi:hypothetical protein
MFLILRVDILCLFLMPCTDFQEHHDGFIFINDFLEEIVDSQIKLFYIACFLSFLSVHFRLLCTNFRSASINNAEYLHYSLVCYCYQSVIVVN